MSAYTKFDTYKSTCCGELLWKNQKASSPSCSKCGKPADVTFPTSARRRNHALIAGIPEVHGVLGRYEVPNRRGYFVVVKKLNREIEPKGKDRLPDGHIWGLEGTTLLHLKPEEARK